MAKRKLIDADELLKGLYDERPKDIALYIANFPEAQQSGEGTTNHTTNTTCQMADSLISRQAASDSFEKYCDENCIYSEKQRSVMCASCPLGTAFDVIENLPSVQPEPDWKEIMVICDNCGHAIHARRENCKVTSAQPERTGKWIPVDSYSAFGGDEATWMAHGNPIAFFYCSECKEQTYADENGDSILSNYCPHCGARMEEHE